MAIKTIGLLGGMSWESTSVYYQLINRQIREIKGGLHSAPCIIYSFDFAQIEELQRAGQWDAAGAKLEDAARKLGQIGAEAIVLCTNTMHLVSDGIEKNAGIPLIHIVDPTAKAILAAGFKKVALLGTRFTMEKGFYKNRLIESFGLEVIIPEEQDRATVHEIIYSELCNGVVRSESREQYQDIIRTLAKRGAECIILGCTEIGLLIGADTSDLPIFDTTALHAAAAANWAVGD
jgi:aspartate racemase